MSRNTVEPRGRVVHYRVDLRYGDIPYEHWEQAVARALIETRDKHWRHQVRRVVLDPETTPKVRWLVQQHSFFWGRPSGMRRWLEDA